MPLKNILYIDSKAINDYVSTIDGYTYEEETIVSNSTKDKGGKAGIGIKGASIEGTVGKQQSESSTKNVKITEASKLDKVIKYLNNNDELKYYENINDEIWNNIYRDNFLEVLVTPRFSKTKEVSDMARNLNNLIEVFQPFVEQEVLDKKAKKAISGFESLSNINNSNQLTCVFNFEDNNYPLIAYLDEKNLKTSQSDFISQCYMLCKIQKKVEKGKNIELDEIFKDIKSLNLNREQKRKMPKKLSNPKEIKDTVKGPAFVVIPVAIYR